MPWQLPRCVHMSSASWHTTFSNSSIWASNSSLHPSALLFRDLGLERWLYRFLQQRSLSRCLQVFSCSYFMRQLYTFPFINSQIHILSSHCMFLWSQQSNTFYLPTISHAFFTTDQSSTLFSFRMRPANRIEAVTLHNDQHWPSGNWIPMRFEIGSWVTLNPDPNSEWGRESHRYSPNST